MKPARLWSVISSKECPGMSRIVSFAMLVAILLAIAALFYKVMANFLLPLFLAVLLVVIFQPLYAWIARKCGGRRRLASGLTTLGIVLMVLIPILSVIVRAGVEGVAIYERTQTSSAPPATADKAAPAEAEDAAPSVSLGSSKTNEAKEDDTLTDAMIDVSAMAGWVVAQGKRLKVSLKEEDLEAKIRTGIEAWLGPLVVSGVQFTGSFLVGLGVMVIAVYYFFSDGPSMIRTVTQLSPLDPVYVNQLTDQFTKVTRAVVLATLLSAVAQGLLAGVGFFFAGVGAVFFLTVLAMLFAMVPFVGTTIIWAPVCLWLYFFEHRTPAAILLAVYCVAVVAMADNVIKPLVLHGRSNLHPLLALLSVIGGVQAMGPIGIFVGPMVVVFLYVLMNMLHRELENMSKDERKPYVSGWGAG